MGVGSSKGKVAQTYTFSPLLFFSITLGPNTECPFANLLDLPLRHSHTSTTYSLFSQDPEVLNAPSSTFSIASVAFDNFGRKM